MEAKFHTKQTFQMTAWISTSTQNSLPIKLQFHLKFYFHTQLNFQAKLDFHTKFSIHTKPNLYFLTKLHFYKKLSFRTDWFKLIMWPNSILLIGFPFQWSLCIINIMMMIIGHPFYYWGTRQQKVKPINNWGVLILSSSVVFQVRKYVQGFIKPGLTMIEIWYV